MRASSIGNMASTAHIHSSDVTAFVDADSGGGFGGPGGAENDSELELGGAGRYSESTFGERHDPPCFK